MRKLLLHSALLALLVTVVTITPALAQCGCGNAEFAGRVVKSDGVTPIRSARVTLYASAGGIYSTYSNSFGYYVVEVPIGDDYIVTASARGYTFTPTSAFVVGYISDFEIIAD